MRKIYQLTQPWVHHLVQQQAKSAPDADRAMVAVYTTVWRRAADYALVDNTALAWITSITFEVTGALP